MQRLFNQNLGAFVTTRPALLPTSQTAGAGAAINGPVLDRTTVGMPYSARVSMVFAATLGAGKNIAATVSLQDSADGVNFADYAPQGLVQLAASAAGGTVGGEVHFDASISSARQYLRLVAIPTFSAAANDTLTIAGAFILGGQDRLPTPA